MPTRLTKNKQYQLSSSKDRLIDEVRLLCSEHPELAVTSFEIKNYNIGGVWAREMHIPEGVLAIGAFYTKAHIFTISKGSIIINITGEPQVFTAPMTVEVESGTQKACIAIEDSVVTTYIRSDAKTIEELICETTTSEPKDIISLYG